VKAAQDRVLHVANIEQLRTIALDDDDRLDQHLLLCFFTPALEGVVNNEVLYPYPFTGSTTRGCTSSTRDPREERTCESDQTRTERRTERMAAGDRSPAPRQLDHVSHAIGTGDDNLL